MKKRMAILGGLLLLLAVGEMSNLSPVSVGWSDMGETIVPKTNGVVTINTANAVQIAAIPGLGEKKSQSVVKFREKNGPYSRIEDIKKAQGIGDNLFEKIKIYLTVKGETTLKTAQATGP
jgi:competence protein ComEA